MKTEQIVIIGVLGYLVYRMTQNNKETSEFVNAFGKGIGGVSRGQGGRTEPGWGHPSFIKVCEDAGGTYQGDSQGNGNCHNLPPSAPNPLPKPIFRHENTYSNATGNKRPCFCNDVYLGTMSVSACYRRCTKQIKRENI